jgi:hypothetical protein
MTIFYEVFFGCAVLIGGAFVFYKFLKNKKKIQEEIKAEAEKIKSNIEDRIK